MSDPDEVVLLAEIELAWDMFVVPGKRWQGYVDRMAQTGREAIERACPRLPPAAVDAMLGRFFRRYGCHLPVPGR